MHRVGARPDRRAGCDAPPLAVRGPAGSPLRRRRRPAGAADRVARGVRAAARSTGRRRTWSCRPCGTGPPSWATGAPTWSPTPTARRWPRSTSRSSVVQPTTWAALHLVDTLAGERDLERLPARGYATSRADFTRWADGRGRRRLLMEDFYRDARRRLDVLMEGAEPVVGRWNFDADNREPPPQGRATGSTCAEPWWPEEDEIDAAGPRRPGPDGRPRASGSSARTGRAGSPPRGPRRWPRWTTSSSTGWRPSAATRTRSLRRRPLDGPLAALGAAEPRAARPAGGGPGRRGGVPAGHAPIAVGGGLRPPGDRLAGLHLEPLLVPRRGLPGPERARRRTADAGLVRRSWTRTAPTPAACCGADLGPRGRLGPPHPAADGAGQLRHAARLGPAAADRLVPPQLRRRLRLGDGAEHRRHVPVRRRRRAGHQAVRRRRQLHQQDERLLRRLRLRPQEAGRAETPARSPPATGASCTATASASPATRGWAGRSAASTG